MPKNKNGSGYAYCPLCDVYVKNIRGHERSENHRKRLAIAEVKALGKSWLKDVSEAAEKALREVEKRVPIVCASFCEPAYTVQLKQVLPPGAVSALGENLYCSKAIGSLVLALIAKALVDKQEEIEHAAALAREANELLRKDIAVYFKKSLAELPHYIDEDGSLNDEGLALIAFDALTK